MTQLGKSKARRIAEHKLEEKRKERKQLDESKGSAVVKRGVTREITALGKEVCNAGSFHVSNRLASGVGRMMREWIDTNKDSAKYIFEDALGHEGAMAMAAELREATKEVPDDDRYTIIPSGGSTNYLWIQFKQNPSCSKEKAVTVVKLPDPANGPVSENNPFPAYRRHIQQEHKAIHPSSPLY